VKDISEVCISVVEYFQFEDTAAVEMEIINLPNDIILKSHCSDDRFWNMADESTCPFLWQCSLKISSCCASAYVYGSLFSTMKQLKCKYGSRSMDSHFDGCL
jgi:hypothetical protein